MEPQPTTYSCPHCAEKIQRQALTCRFCDRPVTWHITLVRLPETAPFSTSLMRDLFESAGKGRYSSYGAMRKSAETPGEPFLKGLSRQEGEEAVSIALKYGGEARLEADPDEFSASFAEPPGKRPYLPFALALLAMGLLVALLLARKPAPSSSPPESSAPAAVTEVPLATAPIPTAAVETPDRGAPPPPAAPSQQVQIHLRSLIEATATLSGNGITGSAFFIRTDGHLITNHHVIAEMREISVQTNDGKSRPGRLVRSDPRLDLALIQAEGGPYPTLKLGNATTLEPGETVWTIGAPHGLSFTVTRGIVSYVGRNVNGKAFVQADVAINPGNSGGPMINERGEVVGINNFIVSNAVGLNFAIPINYIYMGENPIGEGVIPTSADSPAMARWRAFGSSTTTASGRASRESSGSGRESRSDELDRMIRSSNDLRAEFDRKKSQREATIARLKVQLGEQQKLYRGESESISQESAQGDQIRKTTQEILREQISLADETLDYLNRQEALLNEAHQASPEETTDAWIRAELGQIRQHRTAVQSQRNGFSADLANTEDATY
jgi:hypothetical protein